MPLKSKAPRGPNPATVADGYSLSDERQPVTGPDIDYHNSYGEDEDNIFSGDYGFDGEPDPAAGGIDAHLWNPDAPRQFRKSHEGEHRYDYGGGTEVGLTSKTYLWVLSASVNSIALGYDIGVNTGAAPLVQQSMGLSNLKLEIFFGSLNVFAMIGALLSHYVTDRHGRKNAFMFSAITFICGTLILIVSQGFTGLIVGRLFVGLGVGFGLALDPLYICEISPAAFRGELVMWSEVAMNFGLLLGHCSGLIFANLDDGTAWRFMYALGGAFPCAMVFFANFTMAESPRWLLMRGQYSRAEKVLKEIYGKGYDVTPIILDMQEAVEREAEAGRSIGWDLILFPPRAFRRTLLVGIGLAIAQQVVGIDAIHYFLIFVLEESGVRSRLGQTCILIFVGIIRLLFIFVGGKMLDRKGRRPLLFSSLCGMAAALMMLSVNFFGGAHSAAFSIFVISIYLAMFSFGMGPGAWLVPAEIFSNVIRAKAMSVAAFANRVFAALVSSTFLTTAGAMSWSAFFFMMSLVCFAVLMFLYYFLPETKCRPLEDMSVYFAEITSDRKMLDAEARITREREAKEHAEDTAPIFEPIKARTVPRESLPDAKVTGTMA